MLPSPASAVARDPWSQTHEMLHAVKLVDKNMHWEDKGLEVRGVCVGGGGGGGGVIEKTRRKGEKCTSVSPMFKKEKRRGVEHLEAVYAWAHTLLAYTTILCCVEHGKNGGGGVVLRPPSPFWGKHSVCLWGLWG